MQEAGEETLPVGRRLGCYSCSQMQALNRLIRHLLVHNICQFHPLLHPLLKVEVYIVPLLYFPLVPHMFSWRSFQTSTRRASLPHWWDVPVVDLVFFTMLQGQRGSLISSLIETLSHQISSQVRRLQSFCRIFLFGTSHSKLQLLYRFSYFQPFLYRLHSDGTLRYTTSNYMFYHYLFYYSVGQLIIHLNIFMLYSFLNFCQVVLQIHNF